jgi:NADH-quinone oxidoreductase subunit B
MRGLTLLQDSIEREKRPLSWVVGPQGVVKPPRPSMRDIMRDERRDRGGLEPPDGI